jgi:hypothetical protein
MGVRPLGSMRARTCACSHKVAGSIYIEATEHTLCFNHGLKAAITVRVFSSSTSVA